MIKFSMAARPGVTRRRGVYLRCWGANQPTVAPPKGAPLERGYSAVFPVARS